MHIIRPFNFNLNTNTFSALKVNRQKKGLQKEIFMYCLRTLDILSFNSISQERFSISSVSHPALCGSVCLYKLPPNQFIFAKQKSISVIQYVTCVLNWRNKGQCESCCLNICDICGWFGKYTGCSTVRFVAN